jgi:effector-binding domain-containing protein
MEGIQMSSHPVFNFIPSFYRDQLIDEYGQSLIEPLFNEYAKYLGDRYYSLQQCSLVRSLDSCPTYIEEICKVIDLSEDNRDKNSRGQRFFIDSSIVAFDGLYYDVDFNVKCNFPYTVYSNELDNFACICFDPPIDAKQIGKLYAHIAYHNYHLLRDVWGKLLNYRNVNYYSVNGNFFESCDAYKARLIGLLSGLMNASTPSNLKKSISLFIGLTHAPIDGIIKSVFGNEVTIQNIDREVKVNCKKFNAIKFHVGSELNKYDILDEEPFEVYDIFSDPARFTQYVLSNYGELLYNDILKIDINKGEKYAFLLFDNNLNFDEDGLYFDMGDNSGISNIAEPGTSNYTKPSQGLVNNFKSYTDSRINNAKIYEMVRNLFIVDSLAGLNYLPNYLTLLNDIKYLIRRIKPSRCKCIVSE